jgi:hypothetical protein
MEITDWAGDVRLLPPEDWAAHNQRQKARHAFERTHLGATGRQVPRADGDHWWPETEPLSPEATPAPAPLSRQMDSLRRLGRGRFEVTE